MRSVMPAAAILLVAAATAQAAAPPVIALHAAGVQVYACANAKGPYAWAFKAPDAVLKDAAGHVAGHHFAGPSWQATDGSTVVGALIVSSPAPQPGSVPWLLLRAKSHAGTGVFADIGYIVRTQTEGGVAPTVGCAAAHAGAEARVPYTAIYTLFPEPPAP